MRNRAEWSQVHGEFRPVHRRSYPRGSGCYCADQNASAFPGGTRLDALAFAGGVLPDATLRGMRMFRSHGGTVPAVTSWNLSSEASAPGSDAPCRERRAGRGADTPAIILSRVGTVIAGTAPAFGWPLALRYGSDLLTLRLLSLLQ
jgi:hypothetical protein